MSEEIFGCHNWEIVTGIWWVEVRNAVKPPTAPLTMKNHPAQNVNRGKTEKLWNKRKERQEANEIIQACGDEPSLVSGWC